MSVSHIDQCNAGDFRATTGALTCPLSFAKVRPNRITGALVHMALAWLNSASLLEPPDVSADCRQLAPRRRSRAGLSQPAPGGVQVVKRLLGVAEPSRHGAARSAASARNRQLMVGANAVDPGIDFGRVDQAASSHVGTRFGDALDFPGEASLPLGLGFRGSGGDIVV